MESILKQPTTDTLGSNPSSYSIWISFLVLAPVIVFGCSQCCKKHKELLLGENKHLKEENEKLKEKNEQVKEEKEFLGVRFYRVDLNLDPKTAHPRLEVSEDGKSVKDTGNIHDVSKSKERFECHTFVLAKQLFSEGRYYWEVEVGQKNMWDLGVASESAPRTGKITLSPQNGYWVIGHDNGKDYWARTDPWTCLNMPGKPNRIGIFLNMKSHEISFYVAQKKHKLYTFLNVASGKFYPFFSTGSVIGEEFDRGTLIIPPWFEGEEVVEENEMNN